VNYQAFSVPQFSSTGIRQGHSALPSTCNLCSQVQVILLIQMGVG
jgi:hypothetical protein